MQHIASRESLEATKARVLEVAAPLDNAGLARLGSELDAVSDLLLRQVALRRTLSEGTMAPDTRSGIAGQLLAGKVSEQASAVVQFAVRQPWSSARDLQEALRRVSRTAMFLQAERTGELDDVEDQLFRFARIVEASPELSVILDDPTADPDLRSRLVTSCCATGPTRWSPIWSTRWHGTPVAGRSRTACENWWIRPPSAATSSSPS